MAKKLRKFRWGSLPRLSRQHVSVVNALLTHFPQTPFERGFKDKLRAVLEPSLHADLDVWLAGIEIVQGESLGQKLAEPCCACVIGLAGRTEKALLEIDIATAQSAIDRLLGGDGSDVDQTRPLSEIEEGVISFLVLRALSVVHETFGGERQLALKLEGVCGGLESVQARYGSEGNFAVLSFKLFIDRAVGIVRLFLPTALVESDFSASWPSEGPALERLLQSYGDRKELVRLFKAPLKVEVGRLSLGMSDLDALEADDIVLVESTDASIARDDDDDDAPSFLTGQVVCRIGEGAHGTLTGSVARGQNGRYEVAIESIVPEGEPSAMRVLFPSAGGDGMEQAVEYSRRLIVSNAIAQTIAHDARDALARRALVDDVVASAVVVDGHDDEVGSEHSDAYDEEEGAIDEGDDTPSPEAAGLLDDVTVAMVVELGRVMVSAADIMGLRPGQVIELSRAPGEPVDLVVDGKRIGKGELVEIDGELGVRILSLAR